jgi:thioredoxin-dependent peroxiredoxin
MALDPGDKAPDFTLADQDGESVKLSSLRGQPVVLYFYAKADTPGCTAQACGVRDHRADYTAAGATVLGVSPDSMAKVRRFHEKQSLDFPLLADEDHAVAESYGVWVEKSMYGRKYMGNERPPQRLVDDDPAAHPARRSVRPRAPASGTGGRLGERRSDPRGPPAQICARPTPRPQSARAAPAREGGVARLCRARVLYESPVRRLPSDQGMTAAIGNWSTSAELS